MKVRVAYTEEYAKRRFVEEGVVAKADEVLEVEVAQLSAETRKGLLGVARFDPWGQGCDPGPGEADLDLEWVGPRGAQEGRFLLEGPPNGPGEWDEVLGRFFGARGEHNRRRREKEDAELRKLAAGLRKELKERDKPEAEGTEAHHVGVRRRRRRLNPFDHDLRDYGHATPELRAEVEGLQERVHTVRGERERRAWAEREAREAREAREQDEQEATEKARQAEEKQAWIDRHGSEHLKEAIAAGYDCRDLYVRERAAIEWPEYEPNIEKRAKWKRLSSPSPKALAEAKRVGGRVVRLEIPVSSTPVPEGESDRDDWDPCEAVIVDGYLDRYHLVKEVR